jgi:formylglycine-generating enzyme required for sulfatase activity
VERVSWSDVQEFLQKLNEQSGEPGCVYCLPTEAQWEYACRAGSTTRYYFDDDDSILDKYAWYSSNAGGRTHPVGAKRPNAWGLYDMHGNVWEWCQDWYAPGYAASWPTDDPPGPAVGSYRVFRGGSWSVGASRCRASCRNWDGPGDRHDYQGFRLCRTVPVPLS